MVAYRPKKKRAPRRRRKFVRRYAQRRRARAVFNGAAVSLPFGNRKKAYHRYVEMFLDLNPGAAGVPATYVFSANGMYDPNITGTGHQPLGFDQLAAIFDKYTVIGSKIKVSFINFEGTYENMVSLYVSDDPVPSTSMQQMIEDGACKYTTLTPTTGSRTYATLTHQASIKKLSAVKNIMDSADLFGYSGANPVNQWYWILCAQPNHTTDTANVRIAVQIDYIAIWTDPKRVGQS